MMQYQFHKDRTTPSNAEPKPRFSNVSCSQCGREFGPGNSGYSHCSSHGAPEEMSAHALGDALCHLRGPHLSDKDDRVLLAAVRLLQSQAEYFDGKALVAALDERCMWINPQTFNEAANEIDCCPGCDYASETNPCRKSENGDYCPNDVAETLRAVGRCASAALQAASLK